MDRRPTALRQELKTPRTLCEEMPRGTSYAAPEPDGDHHGVGLCSRSSRGPARDLFVLRRYQSAKILSSRRRGAGAAIVRRRADVRSRLAPNRCHRNRHLSAQHPDRALHGPHRHGAEDNIRSVLRSDRQRHLFSHRSPGDRAGDDLEGLHLPYAGDQSGHGAAHLRCLFIPGLSAAQSTGLPGHGGVAGVQHGNQLHHQHQLAKLQRRDHAVEFQPDGRHYVSDVHFGDDGLRRGNGVDSRVHGHRRRRRSRQFLPRLHPLHHPRAAANLYRDRFGDGQSGRRADARRQHRRPRGSGRRSDHHRRAGRLARHDRTRRH